MAALSYGKRMLKRVLENQRADNNTPLEDAKFYCEGGFDRDGFKVKYISDYKGFGVITTQQFNKGDFLLEYVGERLNEVEAKERELRNEDNNKMFYYHFHGRKMCIDAERTSGHICHFVNDSKDSNAVMKLKVFGNTERLCLFAKKNIAIGEELMYDYGDKEGNLWWRKKTHKSADEFSYDSDDSDPFGLNVFVPNSDENETDSEFDEQTVDEEEDSRFSTISEIIPQQIPASKQDDSKLEAAHSSRVDVSLTSAASPSSQLDDSSNIVDSPLSIPDNAPSPLVTITATTPDTELPPYHITPDGNRAEAAHSSRVDVSLTSAAIPSSQLHYSSNIVDSPLSIPDNAPSPLVTITATTPDTELPPYHITPDGNRAEAAHSSRVDVSLTSAAIPSSQLHYSSNIVDSPLLSIPDDAPSPPLTITATTPDTELPPYPITPDGNRAGKLLKTSLKTKSPCKKKPERYCVYCKQMVFGGKLKRHIIRKHKSNQEIQDILKQTKAVQNQFFDKKRKEGIYKFNIEQLSHGNEPTMRERNVKYEDKLRVCLDCKGYFGNKYFPKHKCLVDKPEPLKPVLLQRQSNEDPAFSDILNRFRDGEIGDLCRTNQTIKMIGYRHFCLRKHEEGKQDEVRKVVMAEMRELAKLFQMFKAIVGEHKTVEDMFQRCNLSDLVQAISLVVTKDDSKTEKHGQKLFLDAVILRSVKTLNGHYSETMQDEKRKELKNFKAAYKHKSSEIFPKSRQTSIANSLEKARKPANLPKESTLKDLKQFITKETTTVVRNYTIRDYSWLRSLVVARLTLYNARRGEEAARMLINEWEDASSGSWIPEDQLTHISDPAEQYLIGQFKLAYLKGKGRKYVSVLIPVDLMDPISILREDRDSFGIKSDNPFLFATKNGKSHCSGWHAVAEVCERAGVSIPVNATKMRHRISTLFVALDMSSKDQKIFLEHMGHDLEVNKQNYQCPVGLDAIRVMGKMLNEADKGNAGVRASSVAMDCDDDEEVATLEHKKRKIEGVRARSAAIDCDDDEEVATLENKKRKIEVKWSAKDTSLPREEFKDCIFSRSDQKDFKGSLPSKQQIVNVIRKGVIDSVRGLPEKVQYLKIRTKLFNERKTVRMHTTEHLKKMCYKKE